MADDPDMQGEDPETHLLPTAAQWAILTDDQRAELVALTADWSGPAVEAFRARVGERR